MEMLRQMPYDLQMAHLQSMYRYFQPKKPSDRTVWAPTMYDCITLSERRLDTVACFLVVATTLPPRYLSSECVGSITLHKPQCPGWRRRTCIYTAKPTSDGAYHHVSECGQSGELRSPSLVHTNTGHLDGYNTMIVHLDL